MILVSDLKVTCPRCSFIHMVHHSTFMYRFWKKSLLIVSHSAWVFIIINNVLISANRLWINQNTNSASTDPFRNCNWKNVRMASYLWTFSKNFKVLARHLLAGLHILLIFGIQRNYFCSSISTVFNYVFSAFVFPAEMGVWNYYG